MDWWRLQKPLVGLRRRYALFKYWAEFSGSTNAINLAKCKGNKRKKLWITCVAEEFGCRTLNSGDPESRSRSDHWLHLFQTFPAFSSPRVQSQLVCLLLFGILKPLSLLIWVVKRLKRSGQWSFTFELLKLFLQNSEKKQSNSAKSSATQKKSNPSSNRKSVQVSVKRLCTLLSYSKIEVTVI